MQVSSIINSPFLLNSETFLNKEVETGSADSDSKHKIFLEKLPKLINDLSQSKRLPDDIYKVFFTLRKMVVQVFTKNRSLITKDTYELLQNAVEKFKNKPSTKYTASINFELRTILTLLKVETQDLTACFKKVCLESHPHSFKKKMSGEERKVWHIVKMFFECKESDNAITKETLQVLANYDLKASSDQIIKALDQISQKLTDLESIDLPDSLPIESRKRVIDLASNSNSDSLISHSVKRVKVIEDLTIIEDLDPVKIWLAKQSFNVPKPLAQPIIEKKTSTFRPAFPANQTLGPGTCLLEHHKNPWFKRPVFPPVFEFSRPLTQVKQPSIPPTSILSTFATTPSIESNSSLDEKIACLRTINARLADASTYHKLGKLLSLEEKIYLKDGRLLTKETSFLAAIRLQPHLASAYVDLADIFSKENNLMINQKKMSKKEIYREAIKWDPKCGPAYFGLANALEKDSFRLLDGTVMTKQDLYLKSIDCNPAFGPAYCNLVLTMSEDKIQLLTKESMTKRQLLLRAIHYSPDLYYPYFVLGSLLSLNESIELIDGKSMIKQELYLEALRYNPTGANIYLHLGCTLSKGGAIQLPSGEEMTQQQLFHEAIKCDPKCAAAYFNLANSLSKGSCIKLNEIEMTQQQLFKEAINCDPKLALAYVGLANTLCKEGQVELLNKKIMTQQQLLLEAIHCDFKLAIAYSKLALTIEPQERIKLLDNSEMTQQSLYVVAIHYDPECSDNYSRLAETFDPKQKIIMLLDGKKMTQQSLYVAAIHYDPKCPDNYSHLAKTLVDQKQESITLLDGTPITEAGLYLKAWNLSKEKLNKPMSQQLSNPLSKKANSSGKI